MSDIVTNLNSIKSQIPAAVKLVAVSKTRPATDIMIAYKAGQKCFGENRVQELLEKKDLLPADIEWHLIGHLQTNKVKYIVPFVSMIQSVDTFKLLKVINTEAQKIQRVIDCLLQIHIAEEETKFGFSMEELDKMCGSEEFGGLKQVNIRGVMGMATFTSDENLIRREFGYLRKCRNTLKTKYFKNNFTFSEISMGMSGDYLLAIQEESTLIRVGSLIFGERKQNFK